MNALLGDFIALFAGVLFTLAFAPFDYVYFSFIALVLIFNCWQAVSLKRALWRGFLFGIGEFGLGVSWVFISIHQFGKAELFSSILLTSLFVSFWSLFSILNAFLCHKQNVLWLPVFWVLVEFLRGRLILNGFPWLLSSYTQLDTPLSGFIPLFGAFGSSFITVLIAALLLDGWQKRKVWQFVLIIIIGLLGSYLKMLDWTHEIGKPISVALLQGNITQDKKWLPENRDKTLKLYSSLIEQHWNANLIVLPETSIPAYKHEVLNSFLLPLHEAAKQHHTDLVLSLPIKEPSEEKFNAVMTLGSNMAEYRKQHLLPFGEFMPWQPISGVVLKSLNIKLGHFTEDSDQQALLMGAGFAFNTSICYEDAFGDLATQGVEQAAFLVNVTNDAWFGHSIEPYQHAQLARMRAIETGRYLLRATNTGLTEIVNPKGLVEAQAPLFEVAVLTGNIKPMTGLTPYALLGDLPVLCVLCIVFFYKNHTKAYKVITEKLTKQR